MMLTTIATFKKHISGVQGALAEATVLSHLKAANREFKQRVGAPLFGFIAAITATASEDEKDLRELAEAVVCWKAYDLAMPHLKMRVSDMGLLVQLPQNTAMPTKWYYTDTRDANMVMYDLFLEHFYTQLEVVAPAVWTTSEAYQARNAHLLRSPQELDKYVGLVGRNARFFDRLVMYIGRAEELYIAPAVTEEVYGALLEKWQTPTLLSPTDKMLIERIRKALGPLAVYEAYPYLPLLIDQEGIRQIRKTDGTREEDIVDSKQRDAQRMQLLNDGQLYLAKLRQWLDSVASETLFPAYHTRLMQEQYSPSDDDFTHSASIVL